MIIISKEYDYYDNIYRNIEEKDFNTVKFVRNTQSIIFWRGSNDFDFSGNPVKKKEDFIRIINSFNKRIIDNGVFNKRSYILNNALELPYIAAAYNKTVKTLVFLIGDKVFLRFSIIDYLNKENNNKLYNIDELNKIIDEKNIYSIYDEDINNLKKIEKIDFTDILIQENVPIMLFVSNKSQKIEINPILKNYEFQKIIDPYTLHYELEMFISNRLTNLEKIPEPTNELKIINHGFDLKESFRKKG